MPGPTAIAATARYIPVGKRNYYWLTTAAAYATPTRTELDAGKDLTAEIPNDGVNGFSVSSDQVDAGDMKNRFVPKVPGLINADDSTINFYCDEDSDDIRSVLARDDEGYIVIFPEGDDRGANSHTMDIWPCKVSSVSKTQGGTDTAQIVVTFSITAVPAEDVAVPSS